MSGKIAVLAFTVSLAAPAADKAVSVPDAPSELTEAAVRRLRAQPPTLKLVPQEPGARSGAVWIRKNPKGLVVLGHVDGGPPAFADRAEDISRHDHVELWLSVTPHPALPTIGWGNQFQENQLPLGELSCAELTKDESATTRPDAQEKCRQWSRQQKDYRALLQRLFVRQWQLAPKLAVETYARPAFQSMKEQFVPHGGTHNVPVSGNFPEALEPAGDPQFAAAAVPSGGYDFQIVVPWMAFPPSSELTLHEIVVMVEVFSPVPAGKKNGPYSTTAPGRACDDTSGFNRIRFKNPRSYQLSSCTHELRGLDMLDGEVPAYFFPALDPELGKVFILENYRGGYAYEPTGFSPGLRETKFFSKQIGPGEYVCGPILRYRRGAQAKSPALVEDGRPRTVVVAFDGFDVRRQPDGTLFIKQGPRKYDSRYGSGPCGACPRAGLSLFALHPDGVLEKTLDVEEIIDITQVSDLDIQMASDWKRVGVYRFHDSREGAGAWDDDFYCLAGGRYQKCGPQQHGPPPQPRTLEF